MQLCDVSQVVALGLEMHEESPVFNQSIFSTQKVTSFLYHSLSVPDEMCVFVNQDGEGITGGIIAMSYENWYGPEREAADVALFVATHKRGGMLAARLIRAYESWAKSVGASVVNLGVSTGVHVTKTTALFNRLGYSEPAFNLRKRI